LDKKKPRCGEESEESAAGSARSILDGEDLFYYLQSFRVWYVNVPTLNHYLKIVWHLPVLLSVMCCC